MSRLFDYLKRVVDEPEPHDVELGYPQAPKGQWSQSHRHSPEMAVAEFDAGSPAKLIERLQALVYSGEVNRIGLVGISADGIIHTAWSHGDELLAQGAHYLGHDIERAR